MERLVNWHFQLGVTTYYKKIKIALNQYFTMKHFIILANRLDSGSTNQQKMK